MICTVIIIESRRDYVKYVNMCTLHNYPTFLIVKAKFQTIKAVLKMGIKILTLKSAWDLSKQSI